MDLDKGEETTAKNNYSSFWAPTCELKARCKVIQEKQTMAATCEANHRGHRRAGAIEVDITELQQVSSQ